MKYFIVSILFLLVFSCKTKEPEPSEHFPVDLYFIEIMQKNGIRLYVNGIEIHDQAIIQKFVKDSKYPTFGAGNMEISKDEKITFLSEDTVQIGENRKMIVENSDKGLFFRGLEKIRISEQNVRLIYNMNKYRSDWQGPGYGNEGWVDYIMVGQGNRATLRISCFNYKLVKAHQYDDYFGMGPYLFRSVYTGNVFNEFNEEYLNTLTKSDTLAIEEYSFVLKSK